MTKLESSERWVVYIIQNQFGSLYTGITTDLERRLKEHVNRKSGAKFFNFSNPKQIVFHEQYQNRSEATKRELKSKKCLEQRNLI